jgi:TctA family transporter
MKTPGICVLAAALAAMASGCASVSYSSPHALDGVKIKGLEGKQAVQQVVIRTTGYYFLWTVPLVSGDIRWNPETQSINGGFSLFDDQVGVNNLQEVLLKIAESRNCDLADVHYVDADTFYDGMSSLFGSSDMSVSALLVPRDPAK